MVFADYVAYRQPCQQAPEGAADAEQRHPGGRGQKSDEHGVAFPFLMQCARQAVADGAKQGDAGDGGHQGLGQRSEDAGDGGAEQPGDQVLWRRSLLFCPRQTG